MTICLGNSHFSALTLALRKGNAARFVRRGVQENACRFCEDHKDKEAAK